MGCPIWECSRKLIALLCWLCKAGPVYPMTYIKYISTLRSRWHNDAPKATFIWSTLTHNEAHCISGHLHSVPNICRLYILFRNRTSKPNGNSRRLYRTRNMVYMTGCGDINLISMRKVWFKSVFVKVLRFLDVMNVAICSSVADIMEIFSGKSPPKSYIIFVVHVSCFKCLHY